MVKSSKHPISKGVAEYIKEQNRNIGEIIFDEYTQIPAKGIVAKYNNITLLGGNLKFINEHGVDADILVDETAFYFVIDSKLAAVYELKDKIKDGIEELISNMHKKGIEVVLLSGDHGNITKIIASEVGIKNFLYEQTPQDKAEYIKTIHKNGKKVVMVGDGVNDILALASADIAIAMGSGSDIAVEVGDVVLLDDSLRSLNDAFKISQTTFSLIKQNLLISLVYNAVTIPLAMAGYIIPLFAAISMSLSSLLVVGNSLRIRYKWRNR